MTEQKNPEVMKRLGEDTLLVLDRGTFYVYKEISLKDLDLYKTLIGVQSPYLAQLYDTTLYNGSFYAILDYIEGQTLEEYLEQNGPLSEEMVRNFASDICLGLSALHGKGIVHRDLTPKNLVVGKDGHLIIIDYGISRLEKAEASSDTEFLGTAGYAAPEQFGFRQSTARTDIYAVGVLMNIMLTGQFPNERLAPGRLQPIIVKCTKMDEADRYQSVEEVLTVLKDPAANETKRKADRGMNSSAKNSGGKHPNAIPGFRQGIWWHKVLAVIYYFVMVFAVAYSPFLEEGTFHRIICTLVFAIWFVTPVPVFTNYRNWTERFAPTRGQPRHVKVFWQIAIYVIALFVSLLLLFFIV